MCQIARKSPVTNFIRREALQKIGANEKTYAVIHMKTRANWVDAGEILSNVASYFEFYIHFKISLLAM